MSRKSFREQMTGLLNSRFPGFTCFDDDLLVLSVGGRRNGNDRVRMILEGDDHDRGFAGRRYGF